MWPTLQLKYGLGPNVVTPHAFARSAIFSSQVFRRHERPYYAAAKELAVVGGMKIYQVAGFQLDQGDAELLYELIRRVFSQSDEGRHEPRVLFNRRQLLASLGRTNGGKTRALLDASIARLFAASYEFRIPGLMSGVSRLLINVRKREDGTNQKYDYDVLIDIRLAQLFNQGEWTLLRKYELDKLGGNPLAKGLYAYYSTHRAPYPIKLETLKALMGRGSMQNSKWKTALSNSLQRVKQATGWYICEIATSGKNAGLVVVVRHDPKQSKRATTRAPIVTASDRSPPNVDAYPLPHEGPQCSYKDYDDI